MDSTIRPGSEAMGGAGSSASLIAPATKRCGDCGGTGEIIAYRNVEDGPMAVTSFTCAECQGSGHVLFRQGVRA